MHSNHLIDHSPDYRKLSFLALAMDEQLYYFEYIENHEPPISKITRINLIPTIKYCRYTFVGSFNGLICLRGQRESICMYNPMTKECVTLPDPKIPSGDLKSRWIGFGYLTSTNEYKVVIMYKVPKFAVVMVYTLGSGNGWRNIGKFDLNYVFKGHGSFANGALHWMHGSRRRILVFDLAEEKFREYLSPPPIQIRSYKLDLGVTGGLLFCSHRRWCVVRKQYFYDIWLYKKKNDNFDMEEQDEHQSLGWSKEFTTAKDSMPLAFTKSGSVLGYDSIYSDVGYLSSYFDIHDPKTLNLPKKLLDYKEQFCQVFHHKHTFVSFKELGEEGTNIRQTANESKKRKRRE